MGIMFSPDMLELVLSGKKTQTRRRASDNTVGLANQPNCLVGAPPDPIDYVLDFVANRTKYRVGNTYAVQPGRGKKGVGRVRLTAIRLERFCDISQADAEAEGFTDPDGFFAKIRKLYGADFDLTAPCWVLEFQLVKEAS